MFWIILVAVVLAISGLVGAHVGRFRDACTEMMGMMLGMTMGMLNGFILGYAIALATEPQGMFWGNLFGILLGLTLGATFGRGGGLMGVMDGAMGGVMGGSMGAMLGVMIEFPVWARTWTALLLGAIYLLGMGALVVLVEQRAPDYADLHRLAPLFARFTPVGTDPPDAPDLINYYEMFDIPTGATPTEVAAAYELFVAETDAAGRAAAEDALATLLVRAERARYDRALAVAAGRGECCPPPRRTRAAGAAVGPEPRVGG